MENIRPDNVIFNSKEDNPAPQMHTKAVVNEKPILLRVFYIVFVGFFAEIKNGIFHFFRRYLVLIANCLKFLWRPDAEEHTKANEATLGNTKETFEFILIISAITIFLIKQDVIVSTAELKEFYGNDLGQYTIEFALFLFYVVCFFSILFILVLLGRLLRVVFKPIESREVTDKVFINLNNLFFILTILYSFVRKFDPYNATDLQNIEESWYAIWIVCYAIPLTIVVFLFFIRLVMINKITIGRALGYCIVAPVLTTLILAICGLLITAIFSGI